MCKVEAVPLLLLPVPKEVRDFRRDICRRCEHAARNAERTKRATKGLTTRSICRVTEAKHPGRANIAQGTERADVACPLGKWGTFTAHESPPAPRQ